MKKSSKIITMILIIITILMFTTVAYGYFDATFGVMTGVYTPQEASQYVEDLHMAER